VGDTASKDTTEHALGIVGSVVGDGPEVPGGVLRTLEDVANDEDVPSIPFCGSHDE
jgi:hypothetical protein